jgi:hypothetical protein
MKEGKTGFLVGCFGAEEVATEIPNLMLNLPFAEPKKKGRQAVRKKPAASSKEVFLASSEDELMEQEEEEHKQEEKSEEERDQPEEQQDEAQENEEEEESVEDLEVDEPNLPAPAEQPQAMPQATEETSPKPSTLDYKLEKYTKSGSVGIREKFGAKRQIFSLTSHTMLYDDVVTIANKTIEKLKAGIDASVVEAWGKSQLKK